MFHALHFHPWPASVAVLSCETIPRRQQRGDSRRRNLLVPHLEVLENRTAPAVYHVLNTNSSGMGSLPWAVTQADNDNSGAPVTIDFTLLSFTPPATIALFGTLNLNNTFGESITVEGPTTGPEAPVTIASGTNFGVGFSMFAVAANTTATIENLTIVGGFTTGNGGGINNAGTLTVSNCTLDANYAQLGGGIYNAGTGTLAVSNTNLINNSAFNNGSNGGGIYNAGTLTVDNSTLSEIEPTTAVAVRSTTLPH